MKRVLITRPEPGATQTAHRLITLGFDPLVTPLFSVSHVDLALHGCIAATVLTSRNAVPACPSQLYQTPAFAVGAATASAARQAGFQQVFSADADAKALAVLIGNTLSPAAGSVFLPVGKGQGQELAASLRSTGFRVHRHVAYRVIGVPELPERASNALRQGEISTALFFSADTARHFIKLLQKAGLQQTVRNSEAVSISERAGMALRSLSWRCIRIAAQPNQDAMLALLHE